MGNSCSKSSGGNFSGEGRTLGATPINAPAINQSAAARSQLPPKVYQGDQSSRPADRGEAGSAAAKAAQERLERSNTAQGKLGKQLAEQKKLTHTDTMKAYSDEQQLLRNAQSNAEARNWN